MLYFLSNIKKLKIYKYIFILLISLKYNFIKSENYNHILNDLDTKILEILKNDIIENVMLLWTNLDILRSVNITDNQKNGELEKISEDLLTIYTMLSCFNKYIYILDSKSLLNIDEYKKNNINKEFLINIYKSIEDTFYNVFTGSISIQFHASIFILSKIEKIINSL